MGRPSFRKPRCDMVSKCQVQGRYDLHSMHLVLVANYETPPATTHVTVPNVAVHKCMRRVRAERTSATLSSASLRNDIVVSSIVKQVTSPRSTAPSTDGRELHHCCCYQCQRRDQPPRHRHC